MIEFFIPLSVRELDIEQQQDYFGARKENLFKTENIGTPNPYAQGTKIYQRFLTMAVNGGPKIIKKKDPVVCMSVASYTKTPSLPSNPIFPWVLRGEGPVRLNLSTRCIWFIPDSIRAPPSKYNNNTAERERVRRLSTKLIEISFTTAAGTQARAKGFKHHCFPIGLKGGERGG